MPAGIRLAATKRPYNDLKMMPATPTAANHETMQKVPAAQGVIFKKMAVDPPDIHGPRRVIDIEIGGGHIWHEVVSVDGVRSTVTQIRPAALIEKRGKS
jgi:hypothetical protein